MNEEKQEEKVPWNERFHLPLTNKVSRAKEKRLNRAQRNGGGVRTIAKRRGAWRG